MAVFFLYVTLVLSGYLFGKALPRWCGSTSAIIMLAIAGGSYALLVFGPHWITDEMSIPAMLLPLLAFLSGCMGLGLLMGSLFRKRQIPQPHPEP
jgi:hypothetical protein